MRGKGPLAFFIVILSAHYLDTVYNDGVYTRTAEFIVTNVGRAIFEVVGRFI